MKCMNLGHKATYLNDTTEKKRMKKDRVRLPKALSKRNAELRKLLLEGLFDPPEIFSFVE